MLTKRLEINRVTPNDKKVYASFFNGNDASKKVMEKCGMKYDHFVVKTFIFGVATESSRKIVK